VRAVHWCVRERLKLSLNSKPQLHRRQRAVRELIRPKRIRHLRSKGGFYGWHIAGAHAWILAFLGPPATSDCRAVVLVVPDLLPCDWVSCISYLKVLYWSTSVRLEIINLNVDALGINIK
jgi:hypothetical protein